MLSADAAVVAHLAVEVVVARLQRRPVEVVADAAVLPL
jgi:hypothetical protein